MQTPRKVVLSELRDARHKLSTFRRADFSTKIEKSASQEAIRKLLEANLTKAGFELDKFSALLKQSDTEARQRLANLLAEADKQAPAVLDTLHRTVENFSNSVEHLKTLDPDASGYLILLDTATEISASAGITLASTHIGPKPEYNTAQFDFFTFAGNAEFGTASRGEVSFGFLWQNPSDGYAVVNVSAGLVLNCFCTVYASGGDGWLLSDGFSNLWVDANLFIHELWNEPPTSPIAQPTQSQNALSLSCDNIGFLNPSASDGASLFRGFLLQYQQFGLPPKGIAMFEVACTMQSWIHGGNAECRFDNNGRQLLCPFVLIDVLP